MASTIDNRGQPHVSTAVYRFMTRRDYSRRFMPALRPNPSLKRDAPTRGSGCVVTSSCALVDAPLSLVR